MQIIPPAKSALKSFWERQFAREVSAEQTCFDLTFGVALPVICLLVFPVVVGSMHPSPSSWRYPIGGLIAIGLSMTSLVVWFFFHRPVGLLAGLMLGSAFLAFLIGVLMFPLSVIGLFFIIGILGFTPFFTAFVYFRNAFRAFYSPRPGSHRMRHWCGFALGILLYLIVPLIVHTHIENEVKHATKLLETDDPVAISNASAILRRYGWIADVDELAFAYRNTTDESHRQRLENLYRELTGMDINRRLEILDD